jgi:hypothetical protein
VHGVTDVSVQLGQLGRHDVVLGRGGQASVFALPNFTLADVPGELVYKRYHVPPTSASDLKKIVSLRSNLDPPARARLDAIAAWPCRIVLHNGATVGVIMPRIPASYLDTLLLPSGRTKDSLREVLNLFAPVDRIQKVGRPVPDPAQRLTVCRDFAAALGFLHDELGVVFGDINAKNELWRLGARPMVMFLDCDAVRPRGSVAATKQLNAPDWDPPEGGELNRATDLYKLGLFILRALVPGAQVSTRRDPAAAGAVLDRVGLDLLTRAVGPVPAARPTAREWTVYLSRLLGEPVGPPALVDVTADRALVLAGRPVEITWTATDAGWIDVVSTGGVARVDGRPGAGVVSVVLDRTGPLTVRAGNEYGEDERTLAPITVVPPPVHRPLDVPMPRLDWNDLGLLRPPRLPSPPLPVIGNGVAAPDPISWVTTMSARPYHPPAEPPRLRAARFPLDLVGMVTATPDIETDLFSRPERLA